MNRVHEQQNTTKCHVCNYMATYLLPKDDYSLFKCNNCKLIFVWPLPAKNFLAEEVYSEKSGYQSNKTKKLTNVIPDIKTKQIIKYLKDSNCQKLLDVGCSNGEFIYFSALEGIEGYGVELNPRTALIAQSNGLKVFQGSLESVKFEDDFFDAIYLGDIIEHVTDPRDLVTHCKKLLKQNGVLIISTPNMDCFWGRVTLWFYKIFKIPPSTLTPPHHLFQFSENNLNLLLSQISLKHLKTIYFAPPRLKYELGMIHALRLFKKTGSIKDLVKMLYSYSLYIVAYIVNSILRPFVKKDFSMVTFNIKINQ